MADYTPRWGKLYRRHPLDALRQWCYRWFHGYDGQEGRKCLHGRYPACNWYPPVYPERPQK